ncbi:protein N-terminal asparagine amidohydrolase [Ranunculus cassubicifolius]
MIFINGVSLQSSSTQESVDVVALLEHPTLVSSSNAFKAIPEMNTVEGSPHVKHVYVFQREYATVDPALVQFVGTDEATTCVGLVIRNPKSGMTSVSHMDSPNVVDMGLNQMLSSIIDNNSHADLDVHLIGGYEDISLEHNDGTNGSESDDMNGYSYPLCSKIIEALQQRRERFHLRTLFVLGHNTRRDSVGNSYPIVNGFMVETCSGSVRPATYDRSSRCPDEMVRRVRVMVSSEDPTWKGKLLETYDTKNDQFQIAACSWTPRWKYIASSLQQFSDSEILLQCSTSPLAEGPDFIDNERRLFSYLIKQPNWRETFPMRQPRVFERTANGGWTRC